jgi:hypothetical protein
MPSADGSFGWNLDCSDCCTPDETCIVVLGCCNKPIQGATVTWKRTTAPTLNDGEVLVTVYACDGTTLVTDAVVRWKPATGSWSSNVTTGGDGQVLLTGVPADGVSVFSVEVNSPTEGYWIENNFNDGDGELTYAANLTVRIKPDGDSCTAPVYDWEPVSEDGTTTTVDTCTTDANGECCTTLALTGDTVDISASEYTTRTGLAIYEGFSTTYVLTPDSTHHCFCGSNPKPDTLNLNDGYGDVTLTWTDDLSPICGGGGWAGCDSRTVQSYAYPIVGDGVCGTGSPSYGLSIPVGFTVCPDCAEGMVVDIWIPVTRQGGGYYIDPTATCGEFAAFLASGRVYTSVSSPPSIFPGCERGWENTRQRCNDNGINSVPTVSTCEPLDIECDFTFTKACGMTGGPALGCPSQPDRFGSAIYPVTFPVTPITFTLTE